MQIKQHKFIHIKINIFEQLAKNGTKIFQKKKTEYEI